MPKTREQYMEELNNRPLRSIRDYIEKDIMLMASPGLREIDEVVLVDGSHIPGKHIDCCLEEVFVASDRDTGQVSYIPYTSIVKTIGTSKS